MGTYPFQHHSRLSYFSSDPVKTEMRIHLNEAEFILINLLRGERHHKRMITSPEEQMHFDKANSYVFLSYSWAAIRLNQLIFGISYFELTRHLRMLVEANESRSSEFQLDSLLTVSVIDLT